MSNKRKELSGVPVPSEFPAARFIWHWEKLREISLSFEDASFSDVIGDVKREFDNILYHVDQMERAFARLTPTGMPARLFGDVKRHAYQGVEKITLGRVRSLFDRLIGHRDDQNG